MGDSMHITKTGEKRTWSRRDSTGAQPTPVDASLFRARVSAPNNAHKTDSYVPEQDLDSATTLSAYHVAKRDTSKPHAMLAAISNFEFKPRGIGREMLLAGTTTKPAWEARADAITAKNGDEGAVLLVTIFGPRVSASDAGTLTARITKALERAYKCKDVEVVAPQAAKDTKTLAPSAGRSFAVFGMSKENAKAAAARYAHCVRIDEEEVVAFGAHLWNTPPNQHVATLEKVDHIPDPTPQTTTYILGCIAEHVRSRANSIGAFLVASAQLFWGKGTLSHDWLDLLLDSLIVEICPDVDGKGHRTVIINVYALGVFTDIWSVNRWADQLLGKMVPLGIYGEGTPAKKRLHCAYCQDTDHHVRICPIHKHVAWFHSAERAQKPQQEPAEPGWTTASNNRGRGGPRDKRDDRNRRDNRDNRRDDRDDRERPNKRKRV